MLTAALLAAVSVPGPTFSGDDLAVAPLGPVGPSAYEVAAEVRRVGFWAGRAIGDEACSGCHPDVDAQWRQSAHRFSSFNNPYYRLATDAFRRERGPEAARFCAGCHEPVLAATGAVAAPDFDAATPAAQAGITCASCHAIEAVDLEGNGRYAARPQPFALEQPFHRARLRAPVMAQPRFCAGCHKVGLPPEVTADRWLRGQDDYDAWHASAIAGNGAGSVFRPGVPSRCQDCHMPREAAGANEQAAKDGTVRSHRFLAANAALPHLRGDGDAETRVRAFLRDVATLDLVWFPSRRRVDVVLRARGVGHRLPGGTNDSNQLWLEARAFDARGRLLGATGVAERDGRLPPDTHLVRAQAVDGDGAPLARRDVQHMRGVVFDTALAPSDPQVVRLALPAGAARVDARLLYRKFSADYAAAACAPLPDAAARSRCLDVPVITIVTASTAGAAEPDWRRLVEHGLGLADAPADRADEARAPLEAARALAPDRPEPLLGLARLALRLGRTNDVLALADETLRRAPEHPAALYLRAHALLRAYRLREARAAAEALLRRLPGDRQALLLAARARGLDRDAAGALAAADAALAIDPESEEAHLQRSLALGDLGRAAEAAEAEARYLRHRAATEIDLELRRRFRARQAGAADEPEPVHTHELRLAPRARSR